MSEKRNVCAKALVAKNMAKNRKAKETTHIRTEDRSRVSARAIARGAADLRMKTTF
jgi:hypothetical protein